MFKNLDRRIQRDIQGIVDERLRITEQLTGGRMKVGILSLGSPRRICVLTVFRSVFFLTSAKDAPSFYNLLFTPSILFCRTR